MIYKRRSARRISFLTFVLFLVAPFSYLSAQTIETKPKVVIAPNKGKFGVKQKGKIVSGDNGAAAEKAIAVEAKVNITLCVSEGNLKVNGWDRNEIRAFVDGGSGVGFRVQQKNPQTGTPVWVKVLGFSPAQNQESDAEDCLSGEEIELDVPRGATVNVQSNESETRIAAVRKVSIQNVGGDIFLNDIAQGIEAKTYEGDVTVENSSGSMALASTTGNIVAFDVGASEIGDVFKAKTNSGAITLQAVRHRQTEGSSNSGSIRFNGIFQSGGQYKLGTQNGSILLSIPEQSSFKLNASYGFGIFNSEIPLQDEIKNNASKARSTSATLGKGEATLNLTTYSGAIRIRKQ